MGNLSLLLFMSIFVPIGMMLFICRGQTRRFLVFLLLGTVAGLFCGEVNGMLTPLLPFSSQYYSINIAPITEEIFKALPILFFVFVLKPERQVLLEVSVAVGIGFAVLENAYVFASADGSISLLTALLRAFGAGMMHGICTLAVGYGMSFVHFRRKLFLPGTLGLLAAAFVYHSMYNNLVLSGHALAGALLPALTLVVALVPQRFKKAET